MGGEKSIPLPHLAKENTDLMNKPTPALPEVETGVVPAVATARKTLTNWGVFTDAGFIPAMVMCDGYRGNHPSDMTCHSKLHPSAENVQRHMDPAHGGGWFKMRLRISEGTASPMWAALQEAGVEIQELYCPHCRQDVPVVARRIIQHLQQHQGANRVNMLPQTLCFTLSYNRPDQEDTESLYMGQQEY